MSLDHPLVQQELARWRGVPPEEIGVAVAVREDGTRVPSVERRSTHYLQGRTTTPKFDIEKRLDLFTHAVEPTLQRDLKHKGTANGDGSYSAEMIGYAEIVGHGSSDEVVV